MASLRFLDPAVSRRIFHPEVEEDLMDKMVVEADCIPGGIDGEAGVHQVEEVRMIGSVYVYKCTHTDMCIYIYGVYIYMACIYIYIWDRGDFRAPWSCFFSNLLG